MTLTAEDKAKLTPLVGLEGQYHGNDIIDGGTGNDTLSSGSSRRQADARKIRLLRSTGKIGQKFELTTTNGLEHQDSANERLWREAA